MNWYDYFRKNSLNNYLGITDKTRIFFTKTFIGIRYKNYTSDFLDSIPIQKK